MDEGITFSLPPLHSGRFVASITRNLASFLRAGKVRGGFPSRSNQPMHIFSVPFPVTRFVAWQPQRQVAPRPQASGRSFRPLERSSPLIGATPSGYPHAYGIWSFRPLTCRTTNRPHAGLQWGFEKTRRHNYPVAEQELTAAIELGT